MYYIRLKLYPMIRRTKVYRQRMWMRHWGADSPKPTNLWSNSQWVQHLSLGTLTKDRSAFDWEMLRGKAHVKS